MFLNLFPKRSHGYLHCEATYSTASFESITGLDFQSWQPARPYQFRPASVTQSALHEGGAVRFLWNDQYLFVMGDMEDSDIVQECNEDNRHLYQTGDLLEVFVKPSGQPSYWELFAAPNQRKSSFFFPSNGRMLPSCFTDFQMKGLICKADLSGTLNNYKDRDIGWRALVAIPFVELEKSCGPLDFSSPWLAQVARYNYSVYLDELELSQIGITQGGMANFHDFSAYVKLSFTK